MLSITRTQWFFTVLVVVAVSAVLTAPFIGMQEISIAAVWRGVAHPVAHKVFWGLRVPRVITAFLAGSALALSGMCFQAIFRNPLATPFTLGVSSGASFGAALYVRLGITFAVWRVSGTTLFAFLGALCSISLVYGLTRLRRGCTTATMLLAGVAVSFFFSSLILFLQYVSDFTHSFRIIRWLMGGVDVAGYTSVLGLLPFVAAGTALIFFLTNELNLMTVGEAFAVSRGAAVGRVKHALFCGVSLMIGGIVAACGPIGFVGMICPHICRLLIGPNHRSLVPATFLFGGIFLTVCDTVARTLVAPAEIPVGVITALLGGPFFLWLLVHGAGERGAL